MKPATQDDAGGKGIDARDTGASKELVKAMDAASSSAPGPAPDASAQNGLASGLPAVVEKAQEEDVKPVAPAALIPQPAPHAAVSEPINQPKVDLPASSTGPVEDSPTSTAPTPAPNAPLKEGQQVEASEAMAQEEPHTTEVSGAQTLDETLWLISLILLHVPDASIR